MASDSSRREFLTGRSALRALADAHEKLAVPLPAPAGERQTWLTQISREAMACEFEILLDAKKYPVGPEAAMEALDLVEALEAQLTIYRETSEVSRLNQRAFEQPVVVEERLFELFTLALEFWQETGGAFDITSGALTKIWGFYRRQGRMPSEVEVTEALAQVGSQHLQLSRSDKSVQFLVPGLEINLGAIGKGHTLDRCAELLVSRGIEDFVIHGGNSSVLARGAREERKAESGKRNEPDCPSPQPPVPSPGFSIGLRHPLRPDQRLAEFLLQDQALGTSGSGSQFFHHQGKRYGHILDPRTGWPAEEVLSATAIAPTAAEADALSTAFYVLGIEKAKAYCEQYPNISALLVTQKGASVELNPVNLQDEKWHTV